MRVIRNIRQLRLGSNVAVFLLFFGVSLLDALRWHQWLRSALWLALGLFALLVDSSRPRR